VRYRSCSRLNDCTLTADLMHLTNAYASQILIVPPTFVRMRALRNTGRVGVLEAATCSQTIRGYLTMCRHFIFCHSFCRRNETKI